MPSLMAKRSKFRSLKNLKEGLSKCHALCDMQICHTMSDVNAEEKISRQEEGHQQHHLSTPPRAWGRRPLLRDTWLALGNTPTGVGKTA